jgi:1A family penicillin-binding protein
MNTLICCAIIACMTISKKQLLKQIVLGVILLGTAGVFVLGGIFLLWASTLTMPTVDIIESQRIGNSTKIYDKTGEVLLYDMYQDVQRTYVPLEEMSDYVKHATIAIEDSGFYNHYGIEPLAIVRAVIRNLQDGDLLGGQGGSTITQQVVKNTLLVNEKKISRKLKEWVLAIKLERDLTKDEILELYLNEVPYGGTKYGIEEASQGFFGKPAKDLTIAESAYLAALPQAPTYYSPYGNNREALNERKNKVLREMYNSHYISEEEYEEAKNTKIEFQPFSSGSIKAPHFVFYVINQLTELYGEETDLAQANLKVITTLDWELQKEAERIVYERAMENSEKFNATNASLMAINPKTGGILVMVGSRDYFDDEVDGNFNIGLAERQPGSSFKPFAYAAALEKGYTTETVVYDARTQFSTACDKTDLSGDGDCYSPGNYDNTFRGPMTFRNALAQSVNVPAVKVLYLAGMEHTIELARRLGITTLEDWKRYGLTLVLGGGEVSLLEMTSAYGVFANNGFRLPHTSLQEVLVNGEVDMFTTETNGEEVLSYNIALGITDILKDNVARTPAFGSDSYLHFSEYDVAVKTGTTNDYRDAWIIGYTPDIAVGAWAGNNNNFAMEKKVAGFIIAPLWNDFMNVYFEKYPEQSNFPEPEPLDDGLKPILRGIVGTERSTSSDMFLNSIDTIDTSPHSILHWVNKDDPRGLIPSNPNSDPQYQYWEYGVLLWSATQGDVSIFDIISETNDSDVLVSIIEPENREWFDKNDTVEIEYSITTTKTIDRVEYFINGEKVGTGDGEDKLFRFMPGERGLERGKHTFLIVVYTKEKSRGGTSIDFRVR